MKKVSSRIMSIIVGCAVLTSTLVGGFSLRQSAGYIKHESSNNLVYMARSYANEFSQNLKRTESYVDALQAIVKSGFNMNEFIVDPDYLIGYKMELEKILENMLSNYKEPEGVYITFNPYMTAEPEEIWFADITGDGNLYKITTELISRYTIDNPDLYSDYPSKNYFMDTENEGMKYLYETMNSKRPIWFEPYSEIGLDIKIISYVVPVIIEDSVVGVVGIDINFEYILKTIQNMEVFKTGYAFLLNEDGSKVLVDPDSSETVEINQFKNGMFKFLETSNLNSRSGVVEYRGEDKDEILGYCKLSNDWILVIIPPRAEIYRPIDKLAAYIIFFTLLSIILAISTAYLFSNKLSKTIDSAAQQLKIIERGDFTHAFPETLRNRDDDLGAFFRSVFAMQTIISDMIEEFEITGGIGAKDILLEKIFDRTQNAAVQAAEAIERITGEKQLVDENLKESVDKLEQLNLKLEDLVSEELKLNRQRDAVMIYQSRQAKLGQMIGNIAHQWRQPLNSLSIILSELEDSYFYGNFDGAYLSKVIDKSRKIIIRMSQTIDNFRNFLSPSAEKEIFSVYKNILFTKELIEDSFNIENIKISIDMKSDAEVWGCSNEFSQVISNILYNSKDALLENPRNKRNIKIEIECGAKVTVLVMNNGPGIPSEILENIFTPYFTTKTGGGGTGIGLYMSRIIVEEHLNGSISFENVNTGVLCRIILPVYKSDKDHDAL